MANYIAHSRGSNKNHKYINKYKSKSGKWVYVYNGGNGTRKSASLSSAISASLSSAISGAANEVHRSADDLKYRGENEYIEKKTEAQLKMIDAQYGDDGVGKIRKASVLSKAALSMGHNQVLRVLNAVGDGKMDDKLVKAEKKGKNFIKSLLGK